MLQERELYVKEKKTQHDLFKVLEMILNTLVIGRILVPGRTPA